MHLPPEIDSISRSADGKKRTLGGDQGFTLVELSVVIVIIALVMTLGLGALNALLGSAASTETKARQARFKEALIAYLGSNKRLPCPDVPNNTNGPGDASGVSGIEDRNAGVCVNSNGVIPYASLGLSREMAEDGWGNYMSYQVFFEGGAGACPGTKVDWTDSNCFGEGKAGGIWVYRGMLANPEGLAFYNTASVPPADSRAVAVIVSHGPNGLGAWTRQGRQNVGSPAGACEEILNATRAVGGGCAGLPVPPGLILIPPLAAPAATTTYFTGERAENDDVVGYLTAGEAIASLAKQGAMLVPTAKANDDIRRIMEDVKGQANALRSTNLHPFSIPPWALDSKDPWGRDYMITDTVTTVISATGTVSSSGAAAVCIYSLGPDGAANTTTTTTCVVNAGKDDAAMGLSPSALTSILNRAACAPTC